MRPLGPANSLIPLPSEEQAHGAGGRTPAHRPRGSNHLRFRVGSAPRAREYAGAGAPQSAGMPALCVNPRRAFETGRKVANNLAVGNFLPGPRAFPAAPLASRPARELAPQMATWQMSPPH